MTNATEQLRGEFRNVLPQLEAVRKAAEEMDEMSLTNMRRAVDETLRFVNEVLVPRAAAEREVLYPELDSMFGALSATAVMSHEHFEILRLTQQLASVQKLLEGPITSPRQLKFVRRDLTRLLYCIYALTRSHISKEDEVYIPLLEKCLSPAEASDLFDRMGLAVADTRARAA